MVSDTASFKTMKFRRRLRYRIILSFLIFGTLLSGLFALTALSMRAYLENSLIDEALEKDLKSFVTDPEYYGFSTRYFAWVGRPDRAWDGIGSSFEADPSMARRLPDIISLDNGVHGISSETQTYRVAVNKSNTVWNYVFYNTTPNPRESAMLMLVMASAFIVFSLIALILAMWSSKRIMAPVTDLANRIATLGDDIHPQPLAPNYAADEVGKLAQALDEYAARLTALAVRDKEFNADVSHELRTPLAVIQSATELLVAGAKNDEKTLTRLDRIKRATRQSTELTEALLHLGRSEKIDGSTGEYYRVDKIVEDVIDFKRHLLGNKKVEVHLEVRQPFLVCAPESVILVVLGNLIGNAFKYTPLGAVTILVEDGQVIVEDTGPGLEKDELQQVFVRHYRGSSASGKGSGLGLAIVTRFCELYDWQVKIERREPSGLRARIRFVETALG